MVTCVCVSSRVNVLLKPTHETLSKLQNWHTAHLASHEKFTYFKDPPMKIYHYTLVSS